MSKKVEVNSPYLFYVNTARNNKPEADGALILPFLKPAGVVLRSVTIAICGLQF